MYMPHLQRPTGGMTLVLRTNGDPTSLNTARPHGNSFGRSEYSVTNIRTMNEVFSSSIAQQRFAMLLVGLFGVFGAGARAIGIYGVMSYSVTQRTHEIGVRMALGAQRTDVLKLILRHGILVSLLGVFVGVAASFGLTPSDGVAVFRGHANRHDDLCPGRVRHIGEIGAIATYLPAWRATRVDPLSALRYA
jgi:putative ABC transport system permease protein